MSEPYTVGIDVSMDRLDVAILPGGQRLFVADDAAGWAELVVRLQRCAITAVGLEPSGGYERGVIRALLAAGFSVRAGCWPFGTTKHRGNAKATIKTGR